MMGMIRTAGEQLPGQSHGAETAKIAGKKAREEEEEEEERYAEARRDSISKNNLRDTIGAIKLYHP